MATQTQLPAAASQDHMPKISNAPSPESATNNFAEADSGSNSSPYPGVDDKEASSAGSQASDLPIAQANTASSGDGAEDDAPTTGSSGSQFPTQPPDGTIVSQDGKMIDPEEGSPGSVPSSPPAGDVRVGNTTSDASDGRVGVGTPSAIAQSIGYRAMKTAGTEASVVVLGLTLLLVCL